MKPSIEASALFNLEEIIALLESLYPRLMSAIDRDPDSPTFGSCDRQFWMYRLHDFDSSVVQQTSATLAAMVLLMRDHRALMGSRFSDEDVTTWSSLAYAINRRNITLLSSTGFADEYYPGEKSYPGTVFIAYATLWSAHVLDQADILASDGLRRTAQQLLKRQPSQAANQDVAAAAFLALYAQARSWRLPEARRVVEGLLRGPDGQGRFLEYGGVDLGYATVSLHYLAAMTRDGGFNATPDIARLAERVSRYVSPDGELGGEYASRSTTYALPLGLIVAAKHDPELARRFAPLDPRAIFARLDDRYLLHYCLPSLARAALELAAGRPEIAPPPPLAWQIHDDSALGLMAVTGPGVACFIGVHKGGALQVVDQRRCRPDCGYRLTRGGLVYATCVIQAPLALRIEPREGGLRVYVEARFWRYKSLVASPLKTVALRLLKPLGAQLNQYFKRRLIQHPAALPGVTLIRELDFDFKAARLTLTDEIIGARDDDALRVSPIASLRVVPSARFSWRGDATQGAPTRPCAPRQSRVFELDPPP
ncbi:hypothetical protein KKF91_11965 [Myxococcota bacterium]|nr:hypothetical protein [Myxococcota bacterium]MBU1431246.1 hypothetical protein [Myxococcota bacterium]MBU1898065.1 hypothetical protein [Myxococcota bacterium]